ncbi:aminotransferases class-v pyridoxal-phosphate attachment site [Trichococcus palustris]|uniref:cysteine desulfurase n=1 Tax=Trichococcus palustris TaxID=140314 RepID=A0A143YQP6_9LACT|nr:aminotransferases class-v pyridoxal-phosphate attachment site [Trichococcus palustris]SFK92667.1 cysteine desulfurase [Trichococcus palustris]
MIYFDHAATTPVNPEVIAVIRESLLADFGNPSSTYTIGRETRRHIEDARRIFANAIHAVPADIIMTSCGSESNNTAIIATALALRAKGKHLITSAVEHHSVLHPMAYLETMGFEVTYLPVDEKGNIAISDLENALREDTILVSIMYANNEVGTLNPIAEIGTLLAEKDILFHTDAVQAFGSEEIDVDAQHIDLLSVSAHKINGPKGIGFLFRRSDLHLPNYIHGGSQENNHRAGTENTPYIRGFAKAVEMTLLHRSEANQCKRDLRDYFLSSLEKAGIPFQINGDYPNGVPHILNMWLPGMRSDKLLIQCDLKGIMLSAGSACTAGSLEPSHVLEAMFGKENPRAAESLRISFGKANTKEEIDTFIALLASIYAKQYGNN